MDYIFYDTETTGISPYFDQILQFAAIRTDENFKELERFEVRCRIQPHILPNPAAMRVTRIPASELTNPEYPSHYEMMKVIRKKLLSWQPAIFLGHNTLAFDEPMLRSNFYQTLLPVYLTNTNGNMRMDSLPILQAISVLAPDAINIPINDNGRQSFKLDLIAPANGFNHDNAHEAMSDVEATIFICKAVNKAVPQIWSSFRDHADKMKVSDFINRKLPFALIKTHFGKISVSPVATIGVDNRNSNEVLALNLAYNPDELRALNDTEIQSLMLRPPKPILTFRANAMPSICSLKEHSALIDTIDLDFKTVSERGNALYKYPALLARLKDLYQSQKKEFEESPYVERRIYSGFPSRKDENLMSAFHKLGWEGRWDIVQSFSDTRYRELGQRLLYFYAPQTMPTSARSVWAEKVRKRLHSEAPDTEWLTLSKAIDDTNKMIEGSDGATKTLLLGHLRRYQYMMAKTQA